MAIVSSTFFVLAVIARSTPADPKDAFAVYSFHSQEHI
jgi:hypothetical protein